MDITKLDPDTPMRRETALALIADATRWEKLHREAVAKLRARDRVVHDVLSRIATGIVAPEIAPKLCRAALGALFPKNPAGLTSISPDDLGYECWEELHERLKIGEIPGEQMSIAPSSASQGTHP